MAYVKVKLSEWLLANPNYDSFKGTAAGTPLIYQIKVGAPGLTAEDWYVWDYSNEFPDTSQSPANADVSPTGKTNRVLLNIVPEAPAASELPVFLGEDTDATLDAVQGFVDEYKAKEQGALLYLGNFLGVGKKTLVYAAAISWDAGISGTFPDPTETTLSVTPSFGDYRELVTITNVGG